jgi:hypothetical protein
MNKKFLRFKLSISNCNFIFFSILTLLLLFIAGCSNNFSKIVGKVYFYQDSTLELTAGFGKDTLYYIMKDAGPPRFHKSKYKLNKVNDSTFQLELLDKPKFWEKNTWEIVVRNAGEIYSTESNKTYKIYSDTLFKF